MILKDFSLDYLGWESHTSPEIKVVKVQDEAALQDATQDVKEERKLIAFNRRFTIMV